MGGPSTSGAVGLAGPKHGPDDPCVLVGDGNRCTVVAAPFAKLVDPLVDGICLVPGRAHDGAAAVDQ